MLFFGKTTVGTCNVSNPEQLECVLYLVTPYVDLFLHVRSESIQDHHAFERILDEDVAAGRIPLLVVAVVGSTILGQNDMVSKILETRKRHRFWLHTVGQV